MPLLFLCFLMSAILSYRTLIDKRGQMIYNIRIDV